MKNIESIIEVKKKIYFQNIRNKSNLQTGELVYGLYDKQQNRYK